jgi:DNA-binding transcriptional LysR family regulator
MDRIDAMKVFVTAVDEGSLAGAARRLKRSPTAVSRALSFLEARLGVELLHRTTRTLKLSEAGERYAAACRRALTDLNEAEMLASCERSSPRGVLTISAPPVNGEETLRPIIDEFLKRYPDVSVTILRRSRRPMFLFRG